MRARLAILGAAAGLMLSLGADTAEANRRDDCWKKINKAEHKLNEAIRKHGWRSRQADNRRQELRRVQARCGSSFYGNRGRTDNWWGRDRRDRDDRSWRDRDRRDNSWNRGNRVRPINWYWSADGRRHRHSSVGAWCAQRH
jgi:hypothetical protein